MHTHHFEEQHRERDKQIKQLEQRVRELSNDTRSDEGVRQKPADDI